MRIASVEALPAGTACYVRVTAEDGTSGVGESTYFGWPTAVAEIVRSFEPFLKGKDATDVEHLWLSLYRALSFRGMAISGAIISRWSTSSLRASTSRRLDASFASLRAAGF